MRAAAIAVALAACKGTPATAKQSAPRNDAGSSAGSSTGSASSAGSDAGSDHSWPELRRFTQVEPDRVIALPARTNTPRFDVGGPAVTAGIAVVASSQFGFVAVDYHTGQIAWTKPTGIHVAPPLAIADGFVLIGECFNAPTIPHGRVLLGCVRTVTPTGADQGYIAILGDAVALAAFASEPGPQQIWLRDDRTIIWRKGDRAVALDPVSGVATAIPATDPPLIVKYKDREWSITHDDAGHVVAKQHGKVAWHTERPYTEVLGAVYLPEQSPMLRLSNVGRYRGAPELQLLDIDATGSMHGQVAFPVPGIGLIGHTIDSIGDVALAVRLDTSLERDFIAGYAANSLLMWVYPLPHMQRADPIGLAITPDAVLVFHDGDTLTVLPELSAPPTAPGAARLPSENTTP